MVIFLNFPQTKQAPAHQQEEAVDRTVEACTIRLNELNMLMQLKLIAELGLQHVQELLCRRCWALSSIRSEKS